MNFLPLNLHSFSFPNFGLERKEPRKAWGSLLEASLEGWGWGGWGGGGWPAHVPCHPGVLTLRPLFWFLVCLFVLDLFGLGLGLEMHWAAWHRGEKECCKRTGSESWPVPRPCGQRAFAVFKGGEKGKKNRVLGAEWLGMMSVSLWACGHYRDSASAFSCVFKLFFFFSFLKQHVKYSVR